MTEDAEHLRLLSIFHYVVGGLSAFFASIPLVHLAVGIAILSGAFDGPGNGASPPAIFGWLFVAFAAMFIIVGWAYSIGTILAGRSLRRRRGYNFCFVMAALSCANFPFGTCLGVFTLIVLSRPSVKSLFEKAPDFDPDLA